MKDIFKRKDIIVESIFNMLQQYYFISDKNNIKTLYPRIPDNFMTKNGYEDNITKRVCFSTSIGGCLAALSMNCENKEFYVYQLLVNIKYINLQKNKYPIVK